MKLAAIFDHDSNIRHDLMFVNAIKSVNRLPGLLRGVTLVPIIQKIPPDNSFIAEKATCQVLSKGVVGVLGPQSKRNSDHIKSICDNSEIPYIETRPALTERSYRQNMAINLHPDPDKLGDIVVLLIKRYGWTNVGILYEDNFALKTLQPILDLTAISGGQFRLVTKQLVKDREEGYRMNLKEISDTRAAHIILACGKDILFDVLSQAQQLGLVTEEQNWILTDLDAHTIDFKPFKYDFTNFTLFRSVDFTRPFVRHSLHQIVREELKMGRSLDFTEFSGGFDIESALIYDAVHLFAVALSHVRGIQNIEATHIHCTEFQNFWQYGSSIMNFMRLSTIPGLTRDIQFDSFGKRSSFDLDLLNLFEEGGLQKVGSWDSESGIKISGVIKSDGQTNTRDISMMNKTLVVTTILNDPYMMMKQSHDVLIGNDQYEGFVPDMVESISKILHFNVTLKTVTDGKYGGFDGSRWNGMIQEVLTGEADMAVADLSVTTERLTAVDFSMPWMNLGISIIYQKPKKAPPSLLSFLEPFSDPVWIATVVVIFLVALFTFVLGRFSPYEWFNPNYCVMNPEELETQWNISNSVWHTVGALMQQGTDFCPVSLSVRFLVGVFYFFTLILISSYTANLAASLTAETLERPIEKAEDLAEQTKIKYGVVDCFSTCGFFRDSEVPYLQKMWSFMSSPENRDDVMVNSNAEGVEKVQNENGGYAFFMESTSIQYLVERKCDLAQIGGNLDNKGYGIAIKPGSGLKDHLDRAILKMQEDGDFHRLKTKWWKQKRGGGQCHHSKTAGAIPLELANLGGVFVVTGVGCLLAALVCVGELLYGTYQESTELGTTWWYEIRTRVSFAFRCSAFGKKERMASIKYDRRSSSHSFGSSSSSGVEETALHQGRVKRNSFHIHYPGW